MFACMFTNLLATYTVLTPTSLAMMASKEGLQGANNLNEGKHQYKAEAPAFLSQQLSNECHPFQIPINSGTIIVAPPSCTYIKYIDPFQIRSLERFVCIQRIQSSYRN